MAREITIPIESILDLISCAEDFGFNDSTLMSNLFKFMGNKLSDEEIKEFAESYLANGSGYGEEDVEMITDTLTEQRNKYCKA